MAKAKYFTQNKEKIYPISQHQMQYMMAMVKS